MKKNSKKMISFLLAIVLILSVFTVVPLSAYAVEGNGVNYTDTDKIISSGNYEYYTLANGTLSIVRVLNPSATVSIPAKIDKKKVTSIEGLNHGTSFENVFRDSQKVERVVLPDTITSVGEYAFSGCLTLKTITVPKSVKTISAGSIGFVDPYSGNEKVQGLTIRGYKGTAAETYAKNNGFAFTTLGLTAPKVTKLQNIASGIELKWGKISGAEQYRVFRKSGSGSYVMLTDTTALTYVDENVKSGKEYSYTVRCLSKDGSIYTSDYNKAGRSIICLAQPSISRLENFAPGTKLTWDKVAGAASYKVYFKNGDDWKGLATVTTNTYTNTKSKSGTSYTYTVRAVDESETILSSYNTKGWSKKYIGAPDISALTITADGIKITLKKVAGAEKYRVLRKVSSGKWVKIADTTKTNVLDKTAKVNNTYTYTVCCINKDGTKYVSDYNRSGKSIVYLAQPKITKMVNVTGGTKLTWGKVKGAASYKVFLKNGNSWKGIANVKSNTYTYTKTKSGKTYTYTVRAVDKSGNTLSTFNSKGWSKTFVAAPKITSLKVDENGITIKWKKVAGASAYRVYYKTSSGQWKYFNNNIKGTTVRDVYVTYNKKETYSICALNSNGNEISAYNTKGWSVTYKVATPKITSLENTTGGIQIKWNKIAGVSAYRLYYKAANGAWKKYKDITGTSYLDTNVKAGRVETYTVQAINKKSEPMSGYDKNGRSLMYCKRSSGDTYVMISTDHQHVWYIVDGKVYLESDCVTGNYGTADTPKGTFSVNSKISPATLAGDGYSSDVTYWMPFIGNGWGLHDATWRSSFGGDIYKGNGSHGCVNLPYDTAKKMYARMEVGTPVIIY